jgi:hypothetical protein
MATQQLHNQIIAKGKNKIFDYCKNNLEDCAKVFQVKTFLSVPRNIFKKRMTKVYKLYTYRYNGNEDSSVSNNDTLMTLTAIVQNVYSSMTSLDIFLERIAYIVYLKITMLFCVVIEKTMLFWIIFYL